MITNVEKEVLMQRDMVSHRNKQYENTHDIECWKRLQGTLKTVVVSITRSTIYCLNYTLIAQPHHKDGMSML